MNQKIKKILLIIAIFYISLALLFMVLAIFASLSITKAGSVFALSLSVLLGLLLAKCIKTLKNQSFKNKKITLSIVTFFVILGITSTFFLPKSNKNSNPIGDTLSQSKNIEIDNQEQQANKISVNEDDVNVIDDNEKLSTDNIQGSITSENLLETDLIAENEIIENKQVGSSKTYTRTVIENPTVIDKSVKKEKIKVYVGSKGRKYHLKNCKTLRTSKTLTSYTIEEAKAKGYSACGVCNPPSKD